MARNVKFTHLFASETATRGYQKAACGAMVNSGMGGSLQEAGKMAEFCERNASWMPPLCPKCAAEALIAETAHTSTTEN